ncbi:hypothetical protein [Acinetobacter lanii]|uniref:Uncharacterized protein n=1 Tax=Acinetobacter lanii TaxID=2715163 RepID=A0A6G8S1Z6_9GAMM|nr:hypothetical protein [Acinetobacter lanii]QIO08232.1 hypothetical protein G8D99_03820 [Acinetobacter lanii]
MSVVLGSLCIMALLFFILMCFMFKLLFKVLKWVIILFVIGAIVSGILYLTGHEPIGFYKVFYTRFIH